MSRLVALILCMASTAYAQTRQHGNLIFDVPAGWSTGSVREDGTLILISDLPGDECEYCYIYITPGFQGQTRLDTYLFTQMTRVIDDDETPDREVIMPPEIFNVAGRPGAMLGQKIDSDVQVLMAGQLFGRTELIAFEGPASDQAKVEASLAVFQRDGAAILETARFVSDGAKPLLPAPQPGDLSGLYRGFSTYWTMGMDSMMSMQLDHRHLTFWPSGPFYVGTPLSGLSAFDRQAALAKGDMSWGNYVAQGNRLTLAYASGDVRDLTAKGDDLIDGEATLFQVTQFADAATIAGSLSSFVYSGFTPGSGIEGGVRATSFTGFHRDGTWTRDATGGGFGNFDTGGGFASSSKDQTGGTYTIQDGLIIRTHTDGSEPARDLIFDTRSDIMIGDQTLEQNANPDQ